MTGLSQEVRYALRQLRRNPGFTAIAVLTLAIACVAAFFLTRLLTSFLFEIRPTDPVTFLGGILFLAIVASLASYIPARRAARVNPVEALRCEWEE